MRGRTDMLLGFAVAVTAFTASMAGVGPSGPGLREPDLWAGLLLAGVGVAIALRRRAPMWTLLATNVATMAWYLTGYHGRLITLAALICCYTLAASRGWRWAAAGWLITAMCTVLAVRMAFGGPWFGDQVINGLMLELVTVALGAAVHYHRAYAISLQAQADQVAEARAEVARRQAAEMRLGIARELHDVLGHTMAAVSVQAGVAVHVMQQRPEQASEALTAIKKISDEGLAEVRTLLTMLRTADTPAQLPSPGLARLGDLIELTRASGMHVEVKVRGKGPELERDVDNAAYRIIQESLTNVRRHANATTVSIDVSHYPEVLEIAIGDNGSRPLAVASHHIQGQGIVGMRARAVALGGSLTAGPQQNGGFAVRCRIPIKGSS